MSTPRNERVFELTTLIVIGTDCTSSCKSNYHMITTTTTPIIIIYRVLPNNTTNIQNSKKSLSCHPEVITSFTTHITGSVLDIHTPNNNNNWCGERCSPPFFLQKMAKYIYCTCSIWFIRLPVVATIPDIRDLLMTPWLDLTPPYTKSWIGACYVYLMWWNIK